MTEFSSYKYGLYTRVCIYNMCQKKVSWSDWIYFFKSFYWFKSTFLVIGGSFSDQSIYPLNPSILEIHSSLKSIDPWNQFILKLTPWNQPILKIHSFLKSIITKNQFFFEINPSLKSILPWNQFIRIIDLSMKSILLWNQSIPKINSSLNNNSFLKSVLPWN